MEKRVQPDTDSFHRAESVGNVFAKRRCPLLKGTFVVTLGDWPIVTGGWQRKSDQPATIVWSWGLVKYHSLSIRYVDRSFQVLHIFGLKVGVFSEYSFFFKHGTIGTFVYFLVLSCVL